MIQLGIGFDLLELRNRGTNNQKQQQQQKGKLNYPHIPQIISSNQHNQP